MEPIKFKGQAGEYFGIWIVNLLLTVITIGIYGAWAKVRTKKYFSSNTEIDGHSFGYHATGWQILKGRILVALVSLVFVLGAVFTSAVGELAAGVYVIFVFILALLALPWIVNNALKFSARMTSYRNIRLNWRGTYGQTLFIYYITPLLSIISLGLLIPLVTKYYFNYYAKGHYYGTSGFRTEASTNDFFRGALRSGLLPSLVLFYVLIIYLVVFFVGDYMYFYANPEDIDITAEIAYALGSLVFLLPVLIISTVFTNLIFRIMSRNILLNSLALSNNEDKEISVKFGSDLNPFRYLWIIISNSFVAVITLGLMIPWTQIRFYRYLCVSTKTEITGDMDKFLDSEKSRLSAFGEEYAEMEGIEAGI